MNTTQRTRTSRPSGIGSRVRRLVVLVLAVPALLLGIAGPAAAEVDGVPGWCDYVGGVARGCTASVQMDWGGSGWTWRAYGRVIPLSPGWSTALEVKLNRKGMSNTGWIQLAQGYHYQHSYWTGGSASGWDPTYGAWFRMVHISPNGTRWYTSSPRYVTDNS